MSGYPLSLVVVAAAAWAAPLRAQVRASEPAGVTQTIDGTRITVEYSRPRTRSRDTIFGKVVAWGETWTPGANWATTLEVSRDVTIEGRAVPTGKYSVWIVVRKDGDWSAVLDPRHRLFHTQHPDSAADQIRFPVRRSTGPFTEVLTWSFPVITSTGGTLALSWGTLMVPFELRVSPSYALELNAAKAVPYLGRYTLRWLMGPADSTTPALDVTLFHENGRLMGRWEPSPWGPDYATFVLIEIQKDWFIQAFFQNGALYDVEREMVYEFAVEGGKARGFEVRGMGDNVFARGERKP